MENKVNKPEIITRTNPLTAANSYPKVPVSGNLKRIKLTININSPIQQKLRLKLSRPLFIIKNNWR